MNLESTLTARLAETIDPDALVADLFAAEARSLVRLARIFCDDRNAAEDLVQEAFIRLHRSATKIRDPQHAPAFLRSILINLARDHNRRGLMSLRHRNAMQLRDEPPTTEDMTVADESDHEMISALRSLSDRQQRCLVLRFYLEMSEREIADQLGISRNSVNTHCQRGMAALERILEGTT